MSINPLQLAFYKGLGGKWGAVQFNPQRPHWYVKHTPKLKNYEGKYIPDRWLEIDPNLTKDDLASREGAIFLDITSATGPNVYDWSKNIKVTIALSVNDLGKVLTVLDGLASEVKIMHDPGAKSESAGKVQKYLNISSPKGLKAGCMINVAETRADGTSVKHNVPLSCDEVCLLRRAIAGFIPVALGWAY